MNIGDKPAADSDMKILEFIQKNILIFNEGNLNKAVLTML